MDGFPVDVKAFKDFYTAAMSMQADAFHDDPVTAAPDVTMEFTMSSGSVRTYTVGFVPHSQEFYAVVKNGRSDMLVNRLQVKAVLKWLDDARGERRRLSIARILPRRRSSRGCSRPACPGRTGRPWTG